MSRITALRFGFLSTNLDFYDDEIDSMEITYSTSRTIHTNLNNYYVIFRNGSDASKYKIFDINFNIIYGDSTTGTLAKIETLYNQVTSEQPNLLQFYYKYAISTTTSVHVKMIRQGMQWNYFNGSSLANYKLPITFVESKPEGVGMLYSPMLQHFGNGS